MISSEHALLIIDMQQGLFRGPVSPYQPMRFWRTFAC